MEPLKLSTEELRKKGRLVKKDERYEVYDIKMKDLVLSLTVLHPDKSTTGHSHENAEEVYHFISGEGEILLGNKKFSARAGDIFTVPKGTFHRVFNTGKENLEFIAVFEAYEGRGECLKVVIPAAGHGTRFLPITKAQPKEMLPVFDKPTIQYVVEEVLNSGLKNILMVTGRGKRAIEDHFDRNPELEIFLEKSGKVDMLREIKRISELVDINYVRQKEALGLGHAVLQAKDFVGNSYFAVLLGDVITKPYCLSEILKLHEKYRASVIALQEVKSEDVVKYGVVKKGRELEDGGFIIEDLVEKPSIEEAPSNLAIVGRYILSSKIFDILERGEKGKGGEIQLTDAIKRLIESGEKVIGYKFSGKVYDIGNKTSWMKSSIEIALQSESGEELKDYLRKILS